jgi:SAM-dependent methyltransferase
MRDALIDQYEHWIYPKPIPDLDAYRAAGGHDMSDPTRMRRKIWPTPIEPASLDILVAGCGANQAAILAHANPQHRVMGIDLSAQAIAHHQHLKQQHQLRNLELETLAVEDVSNLGRQFDYIVSTGVLHHLADPATGLKALRSVLAPLGAISVMLYGQHARQGVYMLQEAMRTMNVARDGAGVAFARDIVGNLPSWHHARFYLAHAPDLGYDAGFVDTILNARDRAFTVPEILRLVEDAELHFQGWLDELYYSASAAFPAEAKIHDRIYDLPREQQWNVVDLLAQVVGAHRFLVCHPGRTDTEIPSELELECKLSRHPGLRITINADGSGKLEREWQSIDLDGNALAVFQRIDGKTAFRDLLAGQAADERENIAGVVTQLVEWGHLFCELPTLHRPTF